MKTDDAPSLTDLAAEIAHLREQMAASQRYLREMQRLQRRLDTVESALGVVQGWIKERQEGPAAESRRLWLKASVAAISAGGISMLTLAERRRDGTIPRHGWRKINSRCYEYREDVILSVLLGKP